MCGICGYIANDMNREVAEKMIATLKHRGPDNQTVRLYEQNHCVMAHARLSIIDLSTSANQPMEYMNLSIIFNGEVYNFMEIRKELEELGHQFFLQSDTEVILHAYQQWGTNCIDRFIGMFSIAILDREKNELVLIRDRAGMKPLYYYQKGKTFLFASELKGFYPHPEFSKSINKHALAAYFKYGYVPAPMSIFNHVHKLMPGHYLKYDITQRTFHISKYWDVLDFYRNPSLDISYNEAKEQLEDILKSAFSYRMVADVPVGVFLSGGFDSAGVTALLQKDRTDKLKTFTIGFPVGNNEAPAAKAIAAYLGTDHTEYTCTYDDCKSIIPEVPFYFDEPFSDNSAVPTILVSRLARKDVTVALSADAGDETFAGYSSYAALKKALKVKKYMPSGRSPLLYSMANIANRLTYPYSYLREKGEYFAKLLNVDDNYRVSLAFDGGGSLMENLYRNMLTLPYPSPLLQFETSDFNDDISVGMAMDYLNYMPNDILVKVDRSAMSCSLEGREPLLDHRIIEFAAQLPIDYKYKDGVQKRIYKDIVYKYIPRQLMDRPKTGFAMPIYDWLKTDLRYLVDEYINDAMDSEYFHVSYCQKLKSLFFQNKLGHEEKVIWRLITYQMWYQYNCGVC